MTSSSIQTKLQSVIVAIASAGVIIRWGDIRKWATTCDRRYIAGSWELGGIVYASQIQLRTMRTDVSNGYRRGCHKLLVNFEVPVVHICRFKMGIIIKARASERSVGGIEESTLRKSQRVSDGCRGNILVL